MAEPLFRINPDRNVPWNDLPDLRYSPGFVSNG